MFVKITPLERSILWSVFICPTDRIICSSSSWSVSAQFGCIAEMDEAQLLSVKNVRVIDGVGISGWVFVESQDDWKFVIVGNERILKANGGKVRPSKAQMDQIDAFLVKCVGQTVLMMAVEDEIEMLMALSDEVLWSIFWRWTLILSFLFPALYLKPKYQNSIIYTRFFLCRINWYGLLGSTGVSPVRDVDAGHAEYDCLDADWRPGDGGQSGKDTR